ncbi:pyridoxamine 5'-phosphate oxidase family protein [Asticcacaulis sp. 201]|uniref:pyridoxamine 5'-phosphate oxidase family protein n=1 Tax=Asticcacaulis sp. 201 TaxID=3028787 RepID=UPI0029169F60|nr:pyridoxamine 5'-phosphate oxidase family protein [Asticcacaulis sp. 201]MDV6331594.1 pyridoxamine 5'-phosphate oxidase family protein [Asticcacaulis sp. 201]
MDRLPRSGRGQGTGGNTLGRTKRQTLQPHRIGSVAGRAAIERDRAKIDALWSDLDKVWFPAGKDDPNLVLIRFEAEEAEFWDTPGPVATGLAYVKAFMTGELPQVGDVGKANLSH